MYVPRLPTAPLGSDREHAVENKRILATTKLSTELKMQFLRTLMQAITPHYRHQAATQAFICPMLIHH